MMTSGIIIGAHPRNLLAPRPLKRDVPRRLPNEFYPTPPEATRALLSVERFEDSIWEPACGDGAIARLLQSDGHTVVSTDLNDYGYGITGIDFLKETRPRAKHIVTNPSYGSGLADAFVEQALRFSQSTGGKVAMLLNLASLCHRMRTEWWRQRAPTRIYAIDDLCCWPSGFERPAPRIHTQRYCWMVWTPDHRGPSAFWWLSSAEFRGRQSSLNNNKKRRLS